MNRGRARNFLLLLLVIVFYIVAILAPYVAIKVRGVSPDLRVDFTVVNGLLTVSSVIVAAQIFMFKEIPDKHVWRKFLSFLGLLAGIIFLALTSLLYFIDYISFEKATLWTLCLASFCVLFGLATIFGMVFSWEYE